MVLLRAARHKQQRTRDVPGRAAPAHTHLFPPAALYVHGFFWLQIPSEKVVFCTILNFEH